jgi:hypothetical protein
MSKKSKMEKHHHKEQNPQQQKPGQHNPGHNPYEKSKQPQHPSWEKKHK